MAGMGAGFGTMGAPGPGTVVGGIGGGLFGLYSWAKGEKNTKEFVINLGVADVQIDFTMALGYDMKNRTNLADKTRFKREWVFPFLDVSFDLGMVTVHPIIGQIGVGIEIPLDILIAIDTWIELRDIKLEKKYACIIGDIVYGVKR